MNTLKTLVRPLTLIGSILTVKTLPGETRPEPTNSPLPPNRESEGATFLEYLNAMLSGGGRR